jgi:chromosome segregation ATPase
MPGASVGIPSSAPAAGGRGGRGGRGGGGGGYMVMPGEYKVGISKRIAGVETELVKPVAFKVALEGEEKLTATERATIQNLREKVTRVQKSLTATLEVLDNAQGRIGAIRSALEQSPTATAALRKEAAEIEKSLEAIAFSLRGDDMTSVLVEPSPLTTVRRIQDGSFALMGSSLMPTKTRIDSLNIGIEELTAILPKLRTVALEQLPKLEKKLDIMHTPGRLPQLP